MRRLSSVIKPRYDRAITMAIVAMALLAAVAWLGRHRGGSMPWLTMTASMVPLISALSARSRGLLATGVVDEAWIDGGELLLKRAGRSVRMPLTSIASVKAERVGSLVTLELGLPCVLGNRVRFFAAPHNGRDIRDELRRRMAEARQRA